MTRTKYAYVPYSPGAAIEADTVRRTRDGRCILAGRVVLTTNGSEPRASLKEAFEGRYAHRVTVAQLLLAGFTVKQLRELREIHSDEVRLENELKFDEA